MGIELNNKEEQQAQRLMAEIMTVFAKEKKCADLVIYNALAAALMQCVDIRGITNPLTMRAETPERKYTVSITSEPAGQEVNSDTEDNI